tara:strand:+ start:656 stop:970 length:315 start_codon:yes stop_codon:yes gene_type:complete
MAKKMKKPTMAEIKRNTKKTNPYMFDKKTMQFFGQRMSDFKVHKTQKGRVFIYAKSYATDYRTGKKEFMGYTIKEYIPRGLNSDLKNVAYGRNRKVKLVNILNS